LLRCRGVRGGDGIRHHVRSGREIRPLTQVGVARRLLGFAARPIAAHLDFPSQPRIAARPAADQSIIAEVAAPPRLRRGALQRDQYPRNTRVAWVGSCRR
jgi:hypothetical protein